MRLLLTVLSTYTIYNIALLNPNKEFGANFAFIISIIYFIILKSLSMKHTGKYVVYLWTLCFFVWNYLI